MTLTAMEKRCIDAFRSGQSPELEGADLGSEDAWIGFGLHLLLDAGAVVRELRLLPMAGTARFKQDGSPYTEQERAIEARMKTQLEQFCPGATFVGEESGGELNARGYVLAVDPVDGTWALVNRAETSTTTLAFFKDSEPFLGMIQNPATGELAYAGQESAARLLQLSLFGEEDRGSVLPHDRARPDGLLVNLQPQRNAAAVAESLFAAWRAGDVNMLKLTGGSPSWSLLEAAKGRFVYVNLWTAKPSDPFDLAAGVLLVRRAGGEVSDMDGNPIDPAAHSGPFVAAVNDDERARATDLVNRALTR
jgi:fructose-1,6-bisphosphatase/inositol monophosphatase family enzyme